MFPPTPEGASSISGSDQDTFPPKRAALAASSSDQPSNFRSIPPSSIEGGINLYQYGANNPASFTDPFGLKLCFSESDGDQAQETLERSTGTEIQVSGGCATGFTVTAEGRNRRYRFAQWLLRTIIDREDIEVTATVSGARTGFDPSTAVLNLTVSYGRNYVGFKKCSGIGAWFRRSGFGILFGTETEDEVMANIHELSHAADYVQGRGRDEQAAVDAQDRYAAAAGKRLRCDYEN